MPLLTQVLAITLWNLRAIPARLGTSLVICVGIAGVVAVLVTVLAMAFGLERTLGSAGREDRAIVLRKGAVAEVVSALDREAEFALAGAPGIARLADGQPAISREVVLSATITSTDGSPSGVGVRGITPAGWAVRPELTIVRGRAFRTGLQELVVGRAARAHLRGVDIGDTVQLHGMRWTVVGEFTSEPRGPSGGGDVHESELLADAGSLMSAAQRSVYSAATVRLESPGAFARFEAHLKADPRLKVSVERETAHYARQSEGVARLLFVVAYVVGGVMALGALFGALNTMYSAVSNRAQEIATLRALGFGATPVVVSVLVEALLLASLGAFAGAAIAWLGFNGALFSTSSGAVTQVALRLDISPTLVAVGMAWGAVIGLAGGLLPAVHAARLPVAQALRAA
jgi:putative ABC transport system permease protein